jgi:predicted metal-binding membrane protein
MKLSKNKRITISLIIISVSILVWMLLLVNPGHIMAMKHCHVFASCPTATSFEMLLEMKLFSAQLIGWGLMVVAMMLPKLILPIQFICQQSFKRYRFLCSLLFVLGYLLVWMLAGVFMIEVIMGLNLLLPMSYIPAFVVFIIAILWEFSPIKQRFLNRGHDHRILSAFGWKACSDSLLFGITHGVWCIGSGWALMLFPMLLPEGHNLSMILVTFMMISEHLEQPRFPQWHFKPRLKLVRIIVAQTRIKLLPFLTI